jgi:hypothetical protein
MCLVSRDGMKSEDTCDVASKWRYWKLIEVTRKGQLVDLCGPVKGCNAELYPQREPVSIYSWGE